MFDQSLIWCVFPPGTTPQRWPVRKNLSSHLAFINRHGTSARPPAGPGQIALPQDPIPEEEEE
jgi:hypothetical protein